MTGTTATLFDLVPKRLCVCEDTERMVLGTAALSEEARSTVVASLVDVDFWDPTCRMFYRALESTERDGAPLSALVQLVRVSGQDRPTEVIAGMMAVAVPDCAVPHLCKILRTLSQRRNAADVALSSMRSEGLSLSEVAEKLQAAFAVGDTSVPILSAAEVSDQHAKLLAERRSGVGGQGVLTPWEEFNNLTGGLRPGEHWVLGARTSIGKTAVALAIVLCAARQGFRVLMASLEMGAADQLMDRMMAAMAGVPVQNLRLGRITDEESDRIDAARIEFCNLPIDFVDKGACTVRDLYLLCKRLPPKNGLLVVDYLQLLTHEDRRKDRRVQIGDFSRRLKMLSRDAQIPILTLSGMSRPQERGGKSIQEKEPTRFDLKESGDIEADADGVILLHRSDYGAGERTNPISELDIIIDKQRSGSPGRFQTIFNREIQTVRSRYEPFQP